MNYNQDFWRSPDESNPPLTNEMVKKAEEELKLKLPDLLIDMLKINNGGSTQGFVFPTNQKTTWADNHVPVYDIFGINFKEDGKSSTNILDSPYLTNEWGLPEKQIVLTGDGHWWITLDYRKNETEPEVSWIDVEIGQDLLLAKSFEEFISQLVSENDFDSGDDNYEFNLDDIEILD